MALCWCCSFLVSVPVLWTLLVGVHAEGMDRTREENAFDRSVVLATISRLQEAGVFFDTERFLRRVAFVESRDGNDGDTFDSGYYGGIWQVDEDIFDMTQNVDSLSNSYERILNLYLLNWNLVTWQDLRQPLLSAIAAALFFKLAPGDIPDIGQVWQQGEYWKSSGFNTRDGDRDTVDYFVRRVEILESEDCLSYIDLAFALDSSLSVGSDNFELVKDFVSEVVDRFAIGPQETRVAVVTYSNTAVVNFAFQNFTSREEVLAAVQSLTYDPRRGLTNTADALRRSREDVFSQSRVDIIAIPRILVLISDGYANVDERYTVSNAIALKDEKVTIYSVGVGNFTNKEELKVIAGSEGKVFFLEDFNEAEFDNLRGRIINDACLASVRVEITQAFTTSMNEGTRLFFEFLIPEEGMTISMLSMEGSATLYTSTSIPNPNSALYDSKIDDEGETFVEAQASPQNRQRRQTEESSNNTLLFVSVEGHENGTHFHLNTSMGNTIEIVTPPMLTTTKEVSSVGATSGPLPQAVIIAVPSAIGVVLVIAALLVVIGLCAARRTISRAAPPKYQQQTDEKEKILFKGKKNLVSSC